MNKSTDIFLSYSRDDQITAQRFAEGFERAGFSVWWDVTLKSGADYDKVTEDALRSAKAVVVLWSKKSVDSRWVRAEATEAASLGTLVPVMIEPCKRPIMFELKQSAELGHWKGDAQDAVWQTLVNDVRGFVHEGEPAQPATLAANPRVSKKLFRFGLMEMLVLAVVVAVSAFYIVTRAGNAPIAPTTADSAAPVAATANLSLAVLPFANLSDDSSQEYFSDGLTEEMINKLSQVKDLDVTGRNSSFYFKGRNDDLIQIGQKLGVAHVLQGSVRKSGNKIRITAQLMDVKENRNLWSQTYDKELTDIFSIQDEIANAVTTALSITLRAGEFSDPGMTGNVDAYDAFLQGNKLMDQANNGKGTTLDALARYEKAVALDPKFGVGWIRLATFYLSPQIQLAPSDMTDFASKGQHALQQATALVPNHPALQLLQARRLGLKHDYAAAERALKPLTETSGSTEASAAIAYSMDLWTVGRPQDALKYAERASRLDPLNYTGSWLAASELLNLNRPDEAEVTIAKVLAKGVNTQWLSGLRLLAALQKADKAAVQKALQQYPDFGAKTYAIGNTWIKNGDAAALKLIRGELDSGDMPEVMRVLYREFAAALDDPALALELLQTQTNAPGDPWLPMYSEMRKLPGFKDWVRNQGLLDYWRSSGNWGDYCHPVNDDFECK